ncbi:hypothetical protein HJ195_11805 [Vibrio parahaemolyticus]|nr:hypothetical protein [Vibrio parahaemolyticus]
MAETTTNGSNTTLDLKQSFALLSVDKNGIVTMKFGDEVMVFMNDKCPACIFRSIPISHFGIIRSPISV